MDKHGDQFLKAIQMKSSNLVSDATKPHVVTIVTIASTEGGSLVTYAEREKYLVANENPDSDQLLASTTFNVVPPTCGTIVVQGGTIVARNFFHMHHL